MDSIHEVICLPMPLFPFFAILHLLYVFIHNLRGSVLIFSYFLLFTANSVLDLIREVISLSTPLFPFHNSLYRTHVIGPCLEGSVLIIFLCISPSTLTPYWVHFMKLFACLYDLYHCFLFFFNTLHRLHFIGPFMKFCANVYLSFRYCFRR